METEFDKTCLSVVLGATYSNQKLYSCGINPVLARKQLNKVTEAAHETKNAEIAATDIVKLKLTNDIETLEKKLEHLNKLLTADNRHPATRIADLEEEILEMDKRLNDKKEILSSEQPKYRQRYQQTVKRTANSLMDENRIKKRNLGAGAPEKIDSEDEEFLLNCIEEKATAHGRRHDAVLYLNKTVRKRDFKRIINFKRHQQGKKPIRSDTTAYNRARPSNVRHIQAKLHKGRGLFCCKKPTKSEEKNKIHTKHQRAHIKRAVMHLCQHNPDNVLIHSIDDKAYIKPEASDGLDKFRVFLSTDTNTMKRLPKYDFANAKLNITPGSHRYMEKNITNVNGEASIMLTKDQSVCVMRPKFYVGSSGSVWASEDRRLRVVKPDLYEVKSCNFSSEFRIICHRVGDKIRHFIDQTEENDIKNVSNNKVCSHRNYEQERINSVIIWLKKAKKDMDIHTFSISAYEADKLQELRNKVNILNEKLNTLNKFFLEQRLKGAELVQFYKDLVSQCKDLVNYMQTLKLPDTKSVVLELTDAGPGVGKSNRDVRMRATEKVRLDNLDLYARIHRATGDCQNEVERTQAAVGRAIVDGGSIKWKHKSIEDYDNAKQLSFDEYEKLEEEITIHNVLETCKDLSSRVDGSPGPRGDFMEGLVSEDKSDLFYTDAKYLKDFLDASETKKTFSSWVSLLFQIAKFLRKTF
ncbi:unnamed protein product [Mytilus coruscus]|uniref:Uncharacterized protein n=1 Tax=Mytilus coruscus TaxID=42192 RepID=A0A6J8DI92_MYTCO|nr:unnamed protein product [Mytilus coruscus]